MLEGHFVRTVLADEYKNELNLGYAMWQGLSGYTAPLFFTLSGLIFVFLFYKNNTLESQNALLKKGIRRVIELVIWGYALQVNLMAAVQGYGYSDFLISMHVLQCIGLSLLGVILILKISARKSNVLTILLFWLIGISVFCFYPISRELPLDAVPQFFANMINTSYGSEFPLFPWMGFVFLGGILGYVIAKAYFTHFKMLTLSFLLGGWLFTYFDLNSIIGVIQEWGIEIEFFQSVKKAHYLFVYFGRIVVFIGVLMLLERVFTFKKTYFLHSLFLKMGRKTFFIYIVHFILLFGGIFGFGIKSVVYKDFNPTQTLLSFLIFLFLFGFLCHKHPYFVSKWHHLKAKMVRR